MGGRRLLILNWRDLTNPLAGGAEVHIWKVFSYAVAQGWQVAALCSRYEGCRRSEDVTGIHVFRYGTPYTYNLSLPLAYRRVCRGFDADLVIEFLNKLPLFSPLYVKRPLVCFAHHLFGDAARLELGMPAAVIVRTYELFIPRVYSRTPFLAGSESAIENLKEIGIPSENLKVVRFGADTEKYEPGSKSEVPSILYAGRLKRYKGVDHLLKVVPELLTGFPSLKVHIVGRGDALLRLERMARSLGLTECVRFHGYVSEREKCRLYRESWVMCFPSVKEGFGLTVPEAALSGTPTVGYDVPGLRDAIRHDETGLLVPYGNLGALGDALTLVLADQALRERLSESARTLYREYSWQRAAEETMSALERIYSERYSTVVRDR